ncbi:MAG: hypothetical protein JNM04_00285 [Chthonomonas sp.]|nr:hypothetical protein [Chthonomonas sp.]
MKAIGWLVLVLCSAIAFGGIFARSNAKGALNIGNNPEEIVRSATLDLRDDKTFMLEIQANRKDQLFGTYRLDRGNYSLTIQRGFGSNGATGSGTATVNGSTLEKLDVRGSTKGKGYSIRLGTGDIFVPEVGNGKFAQLNSTRKGNGSFQIQTEPSYDIPTVSVELHRDGTFNIGCKGKKSIRVKGTWRWAGNDIALTVTDAFGDDRADGSGTLRIQRDYNNFYRLDISGQVKKGRFNIYWRE